MSEQNRAVKHGQRETVTVAGGAIVTLAVTLESAFAVTLAKGPFLRRCSAQR